MESVLISLLILFFGILFFLYAIGISWHKKRTFNFYYKTNYQLKHKSNTPADLVNYSMVIKPKITQKIVFFLQDCLLEVKQKSLLFIALYFIFIITTLIIVDNKLVKINFIICSIVSLCLSLLGAYFYIKAKKRKHFINHFPQALNLLIGVVETGGSLVNALVYVGENLNGDLGKEFRLIGERLKIGDSPENVFRKASLKIPYIEFYYFILSLQINLKKGGPLKDLIFRLKEMVVSAQQLEKRKIALTAEIRMSAKIISAIPIILLVMFKIVSPDNFYFLLENQSGREILYYAIISEIIGVFIIWWLIYKS